MLEDKPRPGNGPVANIGADQTGEGPPFEMGDLDFRAQPDAASRLFQPKAEFDVLNRRPGVAFVKAA